MVADAAKVREQLAALGLGAVETYDGPALARGAPGKPSAASRP
jgi:hypothetical protein